MPGSIATPGEILANYREQYALDPSSVPDLPKGVSYREGKFFAGNKKMTDSAIGRPLKNAGFFSAPARSEEADISSHEVGPGIYLGRGSKSS